MATVPTQIRIDEELKTQAAELFGQLGLDMSGAVNIFLRQCILHGGLPFKVELPVHRQDATNTAAERGGFSMREFLLQKDNIEGEDSLALVESSDCSAVYSLIKKKASMLAENFVVQSKTGEEIANITREHVLFTPAKMPKVTIAARDGKSFIVKKEIEQLSDAINVTGENLSVRGDIFSEHFELLNRNKCIAAFTYNDLGNLVCVNEKYEILAVLFAFALELVK